MRRGGKRYGTPTCCCRAAGTVPLPRSLQKCLSVAVSNSQAYWRPFSTFTHETIAPARTALEMAFTHAEPRLKPLGDPFQASSAETSVHKRSHSYSGYIPYYLQPSHDDLDNKVRGGRCVSPSDMVAASGGGGAGYPPQYWPDTDSDTEQYFWTQRSGRNLKASASELTSATKREKEQVLCPRCEKFKKKAEFSAHMLHHASKSSIACIECVNVATAAATRKEKGQVLCQRCGKSKSKAEFSAHMLNHTSGDSIACSQCVDAATAAATMKEKEPVLCSRCRESKSKADFSPHMLNHATKESILCRQCTDIATAAATMKEKEPVLCSRCKESKSKAEFSNHMLKHTSKDSIMCRQCVDDETTRRIQLQRGQRLQRGQWKCVECKEHFDREHFSKWLAKRSTQRSDGKQRCNVCYDGQDLKRKEVAERSHASVVKKPRVR